MRNTLFLILSLIGLVGCTQNISDKKYVSLYDPFGGDIRIGYDMLPNGTGVDPRSAISITFARNLNFSSVNETNFFFTRLDDNNSFIPFEVTQEPVTSNFIQLKIPMVYGASYRLTMESSVLYEDNTSIGGPYTFEFNSSNSSDFTAPTLVHYPIDSETNVSVHSSIKLHFSETIDRLRFNPYSIDVECNGTFVTLQNIRSSDALFIATPNIPLPPSTTCNVAIDGVYDLSGNYLPPTSYSFTTAPAWQSVFLHEGNTTEFAPIVDDSNLLFYDNSGYFYIYYITDQNSISQRIISATPSITSQSVLERSYPVLDIAANGAYLYALETNATGETTLTQYDTSYLSTQLSSDSARNFKTIAVNDTRACLTTQDTAHVYTLNAGSFNTNSDEGNITFPNVKQCFLDDITAYVYSDTNLSMYYLGSTLSPTYTSSVALSNVADLLIERHATPYPQLFITHGTQLSQMSHPSDITTTPSFTLETNVTLGSMATNGNFLFVEVNGTANILVYDIRNAQNNGPLYYTTLTTASPITTLGVARIPNNVLLDITYLVVGHASTPNLEQIDISALSGYSSRTFGAVDTLNAKRSAVAFLSDNSYFIANDTGIHLIESNTSTTLNDYPLSQTITSLAYHNSSFTGRTQLAAGTTTGVLLFNVEMNGTYPTLALDQNLSLGYVTQVKVFPYYDSGVDLLFIATLDNGLYMYDLNQTYNGAINSILGNSYLAITAGYGLIHERIFVSTLDGRIEEYTFSATDLNYSNEYNASAVALDLHFDDSGGALFAAMGMQGIGYFQCPPDMPCTYVRNLPTTGYTTNIVTDGDIYTNSTRLFAADLIGVTMYPFKPHDMNHYIEYFMPMQFTSSNLNVMKLGFNTQFIDEVLLINNEGMYTHIQHPTQSLPKIGAIIP
ncbi:MAG: hypothetical protein KU37_04105 [Sulfuricurvum sp. PC08-66]|nr:MAG: hypothetical protein KU37_04105 [Sulfuricurvum sp. PC08-66]